MIPSLLQIPSAVSDSKLHSVLPNNGKGDFQFERSTGATRINRDGLIEEVGYFSSELVQNGNFSELGSEKVTNGDFATDSDWTKGTGWSISNGKAVGSNSSSSLYQATGSNYTSGKTYKIVFTVSDYVSGSVRPEITNVAGDYVTSNGTFTQYIVATSSGIGEELKGASFNGSIDNVSVKQVDPNDRWTSGTGTTISDGNANFVNATGVSLYQNIGTQSGTVKVTFSITNYTSGTLNVYSGGNQSVGTVNVTANAIGNYIVLVDRSGGNNNIIFGSSNSFTGSIDNVSVVEVQGDRPRLSYDITNGVVEDKPHLLLEPSATNLVTFSESMNQYNPFKSTITPNAATSPQGLVNAVNFAENSENNLHYFDSNLIAVTSGTKYTISVFAKYNGRFLTIQGSSPLGGAFATFNLQNGTIEQESVGDASIEAMPNDWYRCIFTVQMNSTANALMSLLLNDSATGGRSRSYLGDGTSGVYLYGFQTEQQSYATSYIPTAGTTITRAAETCLKTDLSNSIGQTEGVLFADVEILNVTGNEALGGINSGGYANHVTIQRIGNTIQYVRTSATQSGSLVVSSGTITAGRHKIAIKYKSGDSDCFLNGEKIGATQTQTFTNGTLNVVRIGADAIGSIPINGGIYGLAVYNEALSESQLMQLTGVTASSIYNNFVTRTASFTVEALNEVKKVIDNL